LSVFGVVRGAIDTRVDAVDDRRIGGTHTGIHAFEETRIVMNSPVGQRLWKWKLAAGLLTIVLGAIVLAWPEPTILVASTLFGVYLLVSGLVELFMAFTLPRSAARIVRSATGGVAERSAWGSNFVAAHSWLAWGLNRLSRNCGGRVSPIPMAGSKCNAQAFGRAMPHTAATKGAHHISSCGSAR
jgi:hypothetical protein